MTDAPAPHRPRTALLAACLLPCLLAIAPAWAEETPDSTEAPAPDAATNGADARPGPTTLRLDQGFRLDLPPGWVLEGANDDPGDASGRRVVRILCETPACARTKEACTLRLRTAAVEGGDDAARLAGLYTSPLARYLRLRAVLKSTSKGATIRRPLGPERFGPRDWIAVETEAAPRFKSGLFAETVIDGRYLGAICKTCETGAVRHGAARALLGSVRRVERAAARLRACPGTGG
ncbi:hypothetical protein ASF53_15035 [Methylobacterium sp. Leaf123]|uniref:hypothetical protein n=1 Tax=Methylobacterium sp. Leaf123 TaxID=1736264 RepID=UPI0006F65C6E|nr:hypothetical protein [Methylobacterium sp. Leaf123]KQQ11979.1 hypothetical protein ASF53_15035 [Methylobacterium sp. Leaf123]